MGDGNDSRNTTVGGRKDRITIDGKGIALGGFDIASGMDNNRNLWF